MHGHWGHKHVLLNEPPNSQAGTITCHMHVVYKLKLQTKLMTIGEKKHIITIMAYICIDHVNCSAAVTVAGCRKHLGI